MHPSVQAQSITQALTILGIENERQKVAIQENSEIEE